MECFHRVWFSSDQLKYAADEKKFAIALLEEITGKLIAKTEAAFFILHGFI